MALRDGGKDERGGDGMDDEGMLERGCRHADAYRHAAQCPANDAMRGGDERLSPANRARSGRLVEHKENIRLTTLNFFA